MDDKSKIEKVSKIKIIKEFLSDKRNKAIVKLGAYFIFFFVIILFIRLSNKEKNVMSNSDIDLPPTITDGIKNLKQKSNFRYKLNYSIVINNIENNISFDYDFENSVYKISNFKGENLYNELLLVSGEYFKDEYGWYYVTESNKNYMNYYLFDDLKLFSPDNIYNYLLKSNYQFKKEDLNNNIMINSIISVEDFSLLNNNIIEDKGDIIIETTTNNDGEESIMLNLTNYYKNIDNLNSYIVNIEIN